MWGFVIALISGVLMSVQGVFNTEVTKSSSVWVANSKDFHRKMESERKERRIRAFNLGIF